MADPVFLLFSIPSFLFGAIAYRQLGTEKPKQPELKPACNSKYHAKYSVGETAFSQIIMCQRYTHEGTHCCNLGSGYQTVGFTWSDQESIEPPTEPSSSVEVPDIFAEAWARNLQKKIVVDRKRLTWGWQNPHHISAIIRLRDSSLSRVFKGFTRKQEFDMMDGMFIAGVRLL